MYHRFLFNFGNFSPPYQAIIMKLNLSNEQYFQGVQGVQMRAEIIFGSQGFVFRGSIWLSEH